MWGGRNKAVDDALNAWLRRLRVNIDAHNDAERRYVWLDNTLGTVSLVSLVGLGTIATTVDTTSSWKAILVLTVTGLGALSSGLQTQLRLGSMALAHQTAARQYAALRRNVEEALQTLVSDPHARAKDIRQQWDLVAGSAPNVPSKIRLRAKQRAVSGSVESLGPGQRDAPA